MSRALKPTWDFDLWGLGERAFFAEGKARMLPLFLYLPPAPTARL